YPTLKLEIGTSHSDPAVAERQAAVLHKYLVAQGVAADRLSPKGYGADAPFATKPLFLDRNPTQGAAIRVSER
ncbi:MAG TPA: hypothetical protein PKY96_17310, partial [Flavobacteriales bacterium]|nr:hypothetical protein [Flavobacteriales bacterium]